MSLVNPDLVFSVLDLETTGFSPRHDRVLEVAIVRIRSDGNLLDEYCTLINPGRDVGATFVHGITSRDVIGAPSFAEVLGDIVPLLRGTVVVGHNLAFDLRFVAAEAMRADYVLPRMPTLCTLALSHRLGVDLPKRKLHVCCEHAGIEVAETHSALADATATSKLLLHYLLRAHLLGLLGLADVGCENDACLGAEWPARQGTGRALRRDVVPKAFDEGNFIQRMLRRLESTPDAEAGIAAYFDVLDRVLEDRRISDEEADALYQVARIWGLKPDDVRRAHRRYLRALVDAALGDGIISSTEHQDIVSVTRLLGFDANTLDGVRAEAQAACAVAVQLAASANAPAAHEWVGKTICFTGALSGRVNGERITRTMAESLVSAAGLVVRDSVTRGLNMLVVADPNSQSTKASRAREYGTRVLGETELWRTLGVAIS